MIFTNVIVIRNNGLAIQALICKQLSDDEQYTIKELISNEFAHSYIGLPHKVMFFDYTPKMADTHPQDFNVFQEDELLWNVFINKGL